MAGPFGSYLNKSVNSTDVLVGAGVGILGALAARYAYNKLDPATLAKLPSFLPKAMPLLGAVAAGGLAYALQRKRNPSRALSHLIGAAAGGVALTAWEQIRAWKDSKGNQPFADIVSMALDGYGVLVQDGYNPPLNGLGYPINDPQVAGYADNPALAEIAYASMNDDVDVVSLMDVG